jgi:transcriptional regulator with XRE-family HTH domain
VTQALVSAIELEGANPTIESIARLAKALGVTVADLFAEAPSRA